MLEPEIVTERGPSAIPAPGKKGHLLVVDNDEAIQSLLSRMLTFMGYDVDIADNGLEAMTLFFDGSYDLVITDLPMPLMNGWELSRLVKEQFPKTPIIVVTGFCEDKRWEKLNMNCIDAIVMKPFKLKEINETVQRLFNRGT